MQRILPLTLVMLLLLPACTAGTTTTAPTGLCGDGICRGPEDDQTCPADCLPTSTSESPSPSPAAPLLMTTMTHMEQGFADDVERSVFLLHVQQLTYGMDLADGYGAILTIESEKPFAIANTTWDLNFMAQIVARGHGVGTHCDFGFRDQVMSVDRYARFFAENKVLVDGLVGAENNLGCSGGGGANDWALAASQAGFKYLDGIVGMHYLSMPLDSRPDPSWTDEYILSEGFHTSAPVDLYERIYPFMVADAQDFIPDEPGVILVSSGELGSLSMLAEDTRCASCPLTMDDVKALVALIQEVDLHRDRDRVAKLTVYLPVNIFTSEYESVLRDFFSQMQALQQQGMITWATQKEVYKTYMEWNR